MAIDTSAFDKYKKDRSNATGTVQDIDISAFGYSWDSGENQNAPTPDAPQRFLGGDTIQSPESFEANQGPIRKESFVNRGFQWMRENLPGELSNALVGQNSPFAGSQNPDTGFLGWMYSGLTRTDKGKIENRVEKLTQPRMVNGSPFQGVPEERAWEIATAQVFGQDPKLNPYEKRILNSAGRWEFAESGLELLDFVPFMGAVVKKGFLTQTKRLAKFSDAVLIGKEIDKIFPKLDNALKVKAVRLIEKTSSVDEVEKILGNIVKEAVETTPVARRTGTSATGAIVGASDEVAQAANRAGLLERTRNAFVGGRRKAPDMTIFRTRIASVIDEVEDIPRFKRAVSALSESDIAAKIRLVAGEDDAIEEVVKKFTDALDVEKKVFAKENPKVNLETPEGVAKYDDAFKARYGVDEATALTPEYIGQVLKIADAPIKKVANAQTVARQTPVEFKGKTVVTNTDVDPAIKVNTPPAETRAINEIAKADSLTLKPVRSVGLIPKKGRDLAKETADNIRKYNEKLPDKEVAKMREQMLLGKETIADIITRKRGIVTNEQALESAKMIKGTLQDIMDLPRGTAMTTEQLKAVEQIIAYHGDVNKRLITLIDNGGAASTKGERRLIDELGPQYKNLTEDQILNRALEENTVNLTKARIVELGIRSEAGRTLQGMRKVADAVDDRLRILFNSINANKSLTDADAQAMIELVSRLDISDSKSFLKALEDITNPDWFEKIGEWSVAAKLWNPTTHVVNFGGNTLRMMADMGIQTTTNPMAAKADFQGAVVGFKRGASNALKALTNDGYAAKLSKYVEAGGRLPAIKGTKGVVVRTPFRLLSASDEIFSSMGYQRKLYRDAHAMAKKEGLKGKQLNARMEELLNRPTFKMQDDATKMAKKLTFQEDLGDIMTKVNALRDPSNFQSNSGKGFAVGMRLFLPFLKTPTNLFKQAVDFSPVGLIKNFPKIRKAIKEGDKEALRTIFGEAILGSAIATYIAMETVEGNITGGAPRASSAKDKFYRENKLPYAIKIGDTWYQYKRIDPFASTIGLTADMVTLEDKNIGGVIGVISENLKDKTYLSGMSDLMKVLTGDEWEREYAAKSAFLGGSMPSIIGHLARSSDPTIRTVDSIPERFKALIPGLSDQLPAKINSLGEEVQRSNKGVNYFFNPIQGESAYIDPVTKGLMEINKAIALPGKDFTFNSFSKLKMGTDVSIKYEFSAQEYEDYSRAVGTALKIQLLKEFRSTSYKNMDNEDREKRVDKIRRKIQDDYKKEYVREKLEGTGGAGPKPVGGLEDILGGNPVGTSAGKSQAGLEAILGGQ